MTVSSSLYVKGQPCGSPLMQASALLGVGMLHQGPCHRSTCVHLFIRFILFSGQVHLFIKCQVQIFINKCSPQGHVQSHFKYMSSPGTRYSLFVDYVSSLRIG